MTYCQHSSQHFVGKFTSHPKKYPTLYQLDEELVPFHLLFPVSPDKLARCLHFKGETGKSTWKGFTGSSGEVVTVAFFFLFCVQRTCYLEFHHKQNCQGQDSLVSTQTKNTFYNPN